MAYEAAEKGEKFAPRDHPEWINKLFLIYPTDASTVQFEDGPSEIVTADVAIIDLIDALTAKPKVLLGARIGGKALVPQIKPKIAKATAALGRLRQLPAQGAKSGAFVLDNEFTPAEAQLADAFELTGWRTKFEQAGPPTGTASAAPATATPAAAVSSGPWFANPDGAALLQKLLANGVANAPTLDHATALMIGASFA